MAIDLLDAPLRVTWDLHDTSGVAAEAAIMRRVAAELAAAGVFFVSLEGSPLRHPALIEVLTILRDGGCRTSLLSTGAVDEVAVLARRPPVETLFVDLHPFLADGVDWLGLQTCVERLRGVGQEPGFSLVPDRSSLPLIPALLSFCRQVGVDRFKLPNTRPSDSFDSPENAMRLRPEDVDALRHHVGDDPTALHAGVRLEVHDLFLWEVLFPDSQDGRSEYGGCQAGNSLAYVDAAGVVHPCSSWPQWLGSLCRQGLIEIWDSPRRKKIRDEVAAVPAGCTRCRDFSICLGGCRGLGRLLNAEGGCRDPLCRAPRS